MFPVRTHIFGFHTQIVFAKYADTFVKKIFSERKTMALAADAVVALNLWMYIAHILYDTVSKCEASTNSSPSGIIISTGDLAQNIDEAAAYWIGDYQETGNSKTGHLLYALTEKFGEKFGQDAGGQSIVNRNIIKLLTNAKNTLTFQNACGAKSNTHYKLRVIIDEIIIQMATPLIQSLIHNLKVNDAGRVKIFALSVVCLLFACL